MDRIDVLLESFLSEDADKCEIVSLLTDVMDSRVVFFFLRTLLDTSEDDVVRIEILKALPIRVNDPKHQNLMGVAVMTLLRQDDDILVRQYAAKAMGHFVSCDGAVNLLEKIALDEQEDDDVRHNAVSAIEKNVSFPECRKAILRIMQIPMFRKSGERAIERCSLPHE